LFIVYDPLAMPPEIRISFLLSPIISFFGKILLGALYCFHFLGSTLSYIRLLKNLTAHSLCSFEPQRTLSFNFFFLSADPGGIGSAFHWAEEGRKEKTTSLREIFVMSIY
jgi:hypothetical protein